jgi:hypothetical protein
MDQRPKTTIWRDFPGFGAGAGALAVAACSARMIFQARNLGETLAPALAYSAVLTVLLVVAIGFVWRQQVKRRREVRSRPKPATLE